MSRHRGRFACVDPQNPEAWGICDRGGEIQKRHDLMPQMRWSGGRLVPTSLLVCSRHMDIPNPQIGGERALRPDPVPVRDPRRPDTPPFYYEFFMTDADGVELLDEFGMPIAIPMSEPLDPPTPDEFLLCDADGNPLLDTDGGVIVQQVFEP